MEVKQVTQKWAKEEEFYDRSVCIWVCLYVCMSARMRNSKTIAPINLIVARSSII